MYTGTESNEAAVCRAVTLAIENNAQLTFMDVVKHVPKAIGVLTDVAAPEEIERLLCHDHREKLLKLATEYLDTGVPIDVVVAVGDPATEIVHQVIQGEHDLVIKSANGAVASEGRLFGSVARSLLRVCPCPVWILKPEIHSSFRRVLCAIDLESNDTEHAELNCQIVELGSAIAAKEDAELHLITAWDLWMENSLRRRSGDAEIDSMVAQHEDHVRNQLFRLLRCSEIPVPDSHCHLYRGHAARIIRSVADRLEADLMVLGTVCRTGAAGFLIGNTAETILDDINCSLLALKPDGFVSPVESTAALSTS